MKSSAKCYPKVENHPILSIDNICDTHIDNKLDALLNIVMDCFAYEILKSRTKC